MTCALCTSDAESSCKPTSEGGPSEWGAQPALRRCVAARARWRVERYSVAATLRADKWQARGALSGGAAPYRTRLIVRPTSFFIFPVVALQPQGAAGFFCSPGFLRTKAQGVFSIGGFGFSIGGFEFSIGGFGFPVGGFGAPLRGNAQKNCRSGWKSPLRQLCLAGFRIPRRRGGRPLRSAVSVRPRARGAARSPACRSPSGLCLKRCRGRPKGVLRRWHWACPAWPLPRD